MVRLVLTDSVAFPAVLLGIALVWAPLLVSGRAGGIGRGLMED